MRKRRTRIILLNKLTESNQKSLIREHLAGYASYINHFRKCPKYNKTEDYRNSGYSADVDSNMRNSETKCQVI